MNTIESKMHDRHLMNIDFCIKGVQLRLGWCECSSKKKRDYARSIPEFPYYYRDKTLKNVEIALTSLLNVSIYRVLKSTFTFIVIR